MIVCYPVPGKHKALRLCRAFAEGVNAADGEAWVSENIPAELHPGDAMFYGVRPLIAHLWEQAKREGREWFYADNAYFDSCRERYFRVTRGAIQIAGAERRLSDGARFAELGIRIKAPKTGGEYVLVCAQSDEFMRIVAKVPDWLADTTVEKLAGQRYIVRTKGANRPFSFDLERASKVVTWSSAAAVMAVLEGVPVECSEQCAAYGVTDRQRWAEALADNQWTEAELRRGDAWRALAAA